MTQVFLMRPLESHEKSQTKSKRIQRTLPQGFLNLRGVFQSMGSVLSTIKVKRGEL